MDEEELKLRDVQRNTLVTKFCKAGIYAFKNRRRKRVMLLVHSKINICPFKFDIKKEESLTFVMNKKTKLKRSSTNTMH